MNQSFKSDIYFCFGNEGHSQMDYSQIKSKIQLIRKEEKYLMKENNFDKSHIVENKEKFIITKQKKNAISNNIKMKKIIAENKINISKLVPISKQEKAKVYLHK